MKKDYTNVLEEVELWFEDLGRVLDENQLFGVEPYSSLWSRGLAIREMMRDPVLTQPLDNYDVRERHPIDQLGLAPLVIEMKERGMESRDVAIQLKQMGCTLTTHSINKWLDEYSRSAIIDRKNYVPASVFDSEARFEELNQKLIQLEDSLMSRDDRDFKDARTVRERELLGLYQEKRQLIKDGKDLMEAKVSIDFLKQCLQMVVEEVNKESPALAIRVWNRIRTLQGIAGALVSK